MPDPITRLNTAREGRHAIETDARISSHERGM